MSIPSIRSFLEALLVIRPHHRCRYGDSPFATKDTFLYRRVLELVGRVGGKGIHLKRKLNLQGVIKSAASAASLKTKIKESRRA